MQIDEPILLLNDYQLEKAGSVESIHVREFSLAIFGRQVSFHIGYVDAEVCLLDLVSPARAMAEVIVKMTIENPKGPGRKLACRRGCSGGCCRYLILLSVPEAFGLIERVVSMPLEDRGRVISACREMAQVIYQHLPKPKADNIDEQAEYQQQVIDWFNSNEYNKLQLACPFLDLEQWLCGIYNDRPIVCREWLVADNPDQCSQGMVKNSNVVHVPLHMGRVLMQTAARLENRNEEIVALGCVFDWFENNRQRLSKTWPAKEVVEVYIDTINKQIESEKKC